MKRLIEKGLMFGNLVRVDSPVLVDRYNRALQHLIGKQTALAEFSIDISGYSPEVGDELGDDLYLNHNGVNRQFILLTLDQATAPLLNTKFSTSRDILVQFMQANRAQLFALTARDAVAGELVNSVYTVADPTKLFDIRRITVEADSTAGTVKTARQLGKLINDFSTKPDAWFDDVLIAQMIDLAKQTGDVTRNPVILDAMSFDQTDFWTAHFGGLYIFRSVEHPAAIAMGDVAALGKLPIAYTIAGNDRGMIARFLELNGLAEPIAKARGIDAAAILHQKMDFIVAEVAAAQGADLGTASPRDMRQLARRYADQLPPAWEGLAALLRWAEENGPWPHITSDHPAYFYTLRASAGHAGDLVNMLLAELTPLDFRQMFICHKEAFYAAYAAYPEGKKAYVADFLERAYQLDKAGSRAQLYGHAEPSSPPAASPWDQGARVADMIDRVGPWGAVKGRG